MRALVTGCAGFIGSHLTDQLLTDGHTVIGIDCFNNNYARDQKLTNLRGSRSWETFEFVPIDLAQGNLHSLIDESDLVFHLAAEPGVRSSWGERFDTYLRNNLLATQHLLDAARNWPHKRFVYASSSSIYGQAETMPTREDTLPRPFSPYGVTKLAAEHMCQLYFANYGVNVVSLRFFSVYGPRQRPDMAFNIFCHAALNDRPLTVFGDGHQTRDFTYVGDVVDALLRSVDNTRLSGKIFNIGGGSQVSVRHAIDLLATCVGRPLRITHLEVERGDVRDTGADTSLALSELGFSPTTSFDEGLTAELEWVADDARNRGRSRSLLSERS